MEEQVAKVVDENTITIPIKITMDEIVKTMFKDGSLINHVIEDSEFDTAVSSILSDNAEEHISDWVSSNGSDIADAISDYIGEYVNENIDVDLIAREVRGDLDIDDNVSDSIHTHLSSYKPGSGCETAQLAAKAIINTIRYDLITSMREENGAESVYDTTITDSLTMFIDRRIEARLAQEKELYLKNKQQYMQDTNQKLVTITTDEFKTFVEQLPFYQVSKEYILEAFAKTFTKTDTQ